MKRLSLTILTILLLSHFSFAVPPSNVIAAFKKMYPNVVNVDWSQKGKFYIADFIANELEKDVWFDSGANWIMTQTDLETLDRVVPAVYNTFVLGQFASWTIDDVISTEFPKRSEIVVIKVGQDNMNVEYQLFYTLDGALQCTRNVSNSSDTLWPGVFECNF